jgi:hypothetical protein
MGTYNHDDEGTEADYLDSIFTDEDFVPVNRDEDDDDSDGGEFVILPNRAREEAAAALFGHPRNRHVGQVSESQREADREKSYQEKRDLYTIAKNAKVGTMIACPNCKKMHLKTTYHKVFCNNQKTHPGKRSCKDRYWNTVDPTRRERALMSADMQGKTRR